MNERFCLCGHNVLSHYAAKYANANAGSPVQWRFDYFRCHGSLGTSVCHCRLFKEDRSLRHRFRRWLDRKTAR